MSLEVEGGSAAHGEAGRKAAARREGGQAGREGGQRRRSGVGWRLRNEKPQQQTRRRDKRSGSGWVTAQSFTDFLKSVSVCLSEQMTENKAADQFVYITAFN